MKENVVLKKLDQYFWFIAIPVLFVFNWLWFDKVRDFFFIMGDDIRFYYIVENNNNILKMAFTNASGVFGPVSYSLMALLVRIFATNGRMYFVFSVILEFSIALLIAYTVYKLGRNKVVAFIAAIIYDTAIYSYYGVTQILGVMELMCVLFSVLMLYFLFRFCDTDNEKFYYLSVLMYALALFSHERFLSYFGIFLIMEVIVFFDKAILSRLKRLLISACPAAFFMLYKALILKKKIFVGTGQTDMKFSISDTLKHINRTVYSIFGINRGEDYLVGYTFEAFGPKMRILIVIFAFLQILVFLCYVWFVIIKNQEQTRKVEVTKFLVFFLAEGASIVCYCVSSRIEMRQYHVPYTFLVMYIAYCASKCWKYFKVIRIPIAAFFMIVCLICNRTYRNNIDRLFFIFAGHVAHEVYDNVIVEYGEDTMNYHLLVENNGDLLWSTLLTDTGNLFTMYLDEAPKFDIYTVNVDDVDAMVKSLNDQNEDVMQISIGGDRNLVVNIYE